MKIWYNIRNDGAGAAYLMWLTSKELAEWDHEHTGRTGDCWGDMCVGWVDVIDPESVECMGPDEYFKHQYLCDDPDEAARFRVVFPDEEGK